MQRTIVRNFLFVGIALVLIGVSLLSIRLVVHANPADLNQRVNISGQTAPLVSQAHLLSATDAQQQLNLSIALQMRNGAVLDGLLAALYDPRSVQYHQYLTPSQFNQLFAPTADTVQQVVTFIQSQGLNVTSVASNNLLIDVSGTVAQVQQAFGTQINTYQLGNQIFYANTTPPSVPAAISPFITSITGLDNSVQYNPLYRRLTRNPAHLHSSSSSHTSLVGQSGYSPKDLSAAYNATPLQSAGVLGDNQTVALFELDGYRQSDVAQYFQTNNLGSPSITNVLVDNASGAAGQTALEVELDIEIVAAMAPHAHQLIYEGPNTTPGLNGTYNKIVTDNQAQIVSISWGLCETSTGAAEVQTLDAIFKQAAAQGISLFAASGDSGSYDCSDSNLAVDFPASDPYVTAVGGTNLQLNAGAYGSETAWANSSDTHRSPKGAGGGGGISNTFKMPSWQTGSGVQNHYSNGNREVPDVSANADPATGYSVYCTVTNAGCPASGWITVAGTSAAAPLWAASTALINQSLVSQGKSTIGYANPALYSLFNVPQPKAPFHDITTGDNLFYPATSGYDLASGIGSPDISNIASDLALVTGGGSGGTPTPIPPTTTPTPTGTPSPTPSPTPTNPPTPTQTPSPTPPPPPASLIKDGDFESGQGPWQESSMQGYQLVDPSNPHKGFNSAYFCGYMGCDDRIWQTFTVPTTYTKIIITYWFYSDTNKTVKQCLDTFTSRLQNSAGTVMRNLQISCNTNAANTWIQQSFDVSSDLVAYKGKSVALFFRGTNVAGQYQTSDFFVDDVVITVS